MKIERIYSWNPLGKAARFVDKQVGKFKGDVNKQADKFRKMKDYVGDNLDKKQVSDFLSKQYGKEVKVGNIKRVDNMFGGMYKWFGGIPADKKYEGGYVFRNGNDIRLYPNGWVWNAEAKQEVLDWFDGEDEIGVAKFR